MLKLRTAAQTDIGKLRSQNEDRFVCNEMLGLYGVADGVGGLPAGEEAAQRAIDEIERAVRGLTEGAELDLVSMLQEANEQVRALGIEISPSMGIGTTLTVGLIHRGAFHIGHVGDSRCYVWHEGEARMLTRDHSVESDARYRRARGEIVYYHEANRNALTRCIGQPDSPEVDVITQPLCRGERYFFCTDGVTRLIGDTELGQLLGQTNDPSTLLNDIIMLANRRGGPDNATGVLVFVDEV